MSNLTINARKIRMTQIVSGWNKYGWLTLIVIIYINRALGYIGAPLSPDAETTYVPYAKRFLNEGWVFLLHVDSIVIAPFAFIWPAIFGGSVTIVKYANMLCGIVMVLLVYGIGRQAHTHVTGLIAALLFARSPLLISWIPTVLSEPPFYFFTLIWLWSIGQIISGKRYAIIISAIALSLSILTRTVWFYPAIVFLAICLAWYFKSPQSKQTAHDIIVAHVLGMLLPTAFIIKNIILFDLPSVALGSGPALFFGTNILTGGFEPPLLGLSYNSGSNPFSLEGNHQHTLVAMEFLKQRSLIELVGWFTNKISWMLLFTSVDVSLKVAIWRAVELAMASIGIWWGIRRRSVVIVGLGLGFMLQLLQTSLVLYNPRYSADNIELVLIPLSAVGLSIIFYQASKIFVTLYVDIKQHDISNTFQKINASKEYGYLFAGTILSFIIIASLNLRKIPVINVPADLKYEILFEKNSINKSEILKQSGSKTDRQTIRYEFDVPQQTRPDKLDNVIWQVTIGKLSKHNSCTSGTISYDAKKLPENHKTKINFNVTHKDEDFAYNFGTSYGYAVLFPTSPGKIILEFDCAHSDYIRVEKIALILPLLIDPYWGRFLKQ